MDSQNGQTENENSFQIRWIIAIVAFLTVVFLLSITDILNRRKRTRRIESRSHFGHFANTEGTSSPSNIIQIPIEAPVIHFESVSYPRVSNNSLGSPIDPSLLPPPSYEEVIATNESTEEPPPSYLESLYPKIFI